MKEKTIATLLFLFLIGGEVFSLGSIPQTLFQISEQGEQFQGGIEVSQQEIPQTQVRDIKEALPQLEFKFPREGAILKGKIKIKAEISQVNSVEFYLRQTSSLIEIYLGYGQKRGQKNWELEIDTKKIPNGTYFLLAKIFTPFGEYQSKEIQIEIENKVERNVEREEKLKEEVKAKTEDISQREKEIKEMVEKTEKEIIETIKETSEEIKEKLPSEEKEKIEEKTKKANSVVESVIEEYKKTIEEEIKVEKGFLPKEKEKEIKLEKESLKEKIVQKGESLVELVKEELSPEEKTFLKENLKAKIKTLLREAEIILKKKIEEKGKVSELVFKDSDSDNLSDWEEIRIGTDPFNPDTDSDGYLDGIEFARGFDPKRPGPADKVVYQNPKKFGKISSRMKIEKVEIVDLPKREKGLKISGVAIPNSFITLYIFSTPLVAMVKVNSQGYFEYILDKPLADGSHIIYIALTNNRGEIEEKSVPFLFSKMGGKIVRISELEAKVPQGPLERLGKSFLILVASLILFSLSLAFFILGILTKRTTKIK